MECLRITIKGIVQGVGFRPFVYRLARELFLNGFVTNTSEGVIIEAEGVSIQEFLERLRREAPPLSRIMSIDIAPADCRGYSGFTIRESAEKGSFTLLSPDISICSDCERELFDRNDRRYLYPFINCTNCGPRYSITRSVPYDRKNTTMKTFELCRDCRAEYEAVGNRRFHAQPNACPICGPKVWLKITNERFGTAEGLDPLSATIDLLKQGAVVAVKGLGGFHLACDALNSETVGLLRERKRKSNKPFALMAPDLGRVKKFCEVSPEEETLLLSEKRPVVLLRKKEGNSLPDAVSPNNRYLAFMLPYTPLHHLLFRAPLSHASTEYPSHFEALVMTSGNMSEEPIVTDNDEAFLKLTGLADAFLLHDREIFMRVDDSVVRIRTGDSEEEGSSGRAWYPEDTATTLFLRRARGYVPGPVLLHDEGPEVLGCGADLKNSFALTKGCYAVLSQHIGDMENYETLRFFEETLKNLKEVYRADPQAIAYDLHPGYLSTRWAMEHAAKFGLKTLGIQHHYAHIASVMAEKGITDKVIGVAFDGNGYGEDTSLWGGEFLVADIYGFTRAGHIAYLPLPGGEKAIREPWRIAVSLIKKAAGEDVMKYLDKAGFIRRFGEEKLINILKISENRVFSPLSSSAGRIFDAVAALTNVCSINTFEGEAAMALESLVLEKTEEDYPVDIRFSELIEIDFSMTILSILNDMKRGEETRIIAARFHNTVASAIIRVVKWLSGVHNIGSVALSGGVFQNLYLLKRVRKDLISEGLNVYINELVPCNDGGISLGQAFVLRERLKKGLI